METIWNLLLKSRVHSSGESSDDLVPPPRKCAKFDVSSSRQAPQQDVLPESTRINDSVFEVYAPQERRPSVEIIFFHGLQVDGSSSTHITTWLSRDQSEVWLYWILEKIPNARILTISYDAHARRSSAEGVMDMYKIRENLVTDLIDAEVGQDGCPVVLVGHCVGGLVMKELCVQANSILGLTEVHMYDESHIRMQNFLQHLKGLFFFASPHHGTRLADKSTISVKGLLFEDVRTNNNHASRRNEDFRKLRKKYLWRTYGLVEGRESSLVSPYLGTFTGFIVAEASARNDVDAFYTDSTADHFEVCQPHSRQSSSFRRLSDFVSGVVEQDNKARHGHRIGFPDEVIGLQDQVKLVLKELKQTPRLGIVGMGGIGKTTLAKTVYNAISKNFEYTCFLSEVKKLFADEETPDNLRATISKDLYWKGRKVPENFKWSTLKRKSVLIVLDDAKTGSQVRVMTKLDCFLEESRVIATSRDRGFLRAEEFKCHSAEGLNLQHSKRLFCLHAFRTLNAPNGFEKQLERILNKCAGLPLALKVAGRYLRTHRSKRFWDATLEKLSEGEPLTGASEDGLWSILSVSYDSLAPAERELFLDVATFFHGKSLSAAKKTWEMCGWQGVECSWQNLRDKGLVTQVPHSSDSRGSLPRPLRDYLRKMDKLDELEPDGEDTGDDIVQMHEVLRDLGRRKACPNPRHVADHTRASYSVSNSEAFWPANQGQRKVEVLKISNPQRDANSPIINMSTFHGLNALRILAVDGGILKGAFHLFPGTLIYLRVSNIHGWIDSSLSQTSAQKSEQHQTLQYLEIESCLDVPSFLEQLYDLKHLRIIDCVGLEAFPSLRRLQALEHLTIEGCHSLQVLPECLGELQALKDLRIKECWRVQHLPDSFGELRALLHLEISGCESLVLPRTLGQLENLEHLEVKNCRALGRLGDVIGQLKALRYLEVMSCDDSDVPLNNLGRLEALEYLRISELYSKDHYWEAPLPDSLGVLRSLKQLWLHGTQGLKALPSTLGDLAALEVLRLDRCCSLETLPETIGQLQALRAFTIIGSLSLETVPDSLGQLQAMQYLHIEAPLKALPSTVGSLQALEYLHVDAGLTRTEMDAGFVMETFSDALGELQALKHLGLAGLFHLKSLPQSLGRLTDLEHLILDSCNVSFPADSLVQLHALEELSIRRFSDLRALPDTMVNLHALKRLELSYCPELKTLPDSLGQLESLEHLDINGCPNLKELPDILKRRGFILGGQEKTYRWHLSTEAQCEARLWARERSRWRARDRVPCRPGLFKIDTIWRQQYLKARTMRENLGLDPNWAE